MRKEGDVSYREESERIVSLNVDSRPQTTNIILKRVRKSMPKMCFATCNRILEKLRKAGTIRCEEVPAHDSKREYVRRMWSL